MKRKREFRRREHLGGYACGHFSQYSYFVPILVGRRENRTELLSFGARVILLSIYMFMYI